MCHDVLLEHAAPLVLGLLQPIYLAQLSSFSGAGRNPIRIPTRPGQVAQFQGQVPIAVIFGHGPRPMAQQAGWNGHSHGKTRGISWIVYEISEGNPKSL